MKGLGPWNSFGVGLKTRLSPPPPPPPDYAQMIRDMAIRDLIAETLSENESLNSQQTSSEQRR